jgi:hypothetical protein
MSNYSVRLPFRAESPTVLHVLLPIAFDGCQIRRRTICYHGKAEASEARCPAVDSHREATARCYFSQGN